MRAVNLLPRDEARTHVEGGRTALLLAAGGIAFVTLVVGWLAVSASGTADDAKTELQAVRLQFKKVPKAPRPVVSQSVLAQERTDRVAALAAALSSRVAFDRLFRDVSLVLPEDAWLTSMSAASAGDGSASSASKSEGEGISIQGATYTHASVARVLSRLAVLPSLANVSLESSSVVEPETSRATSSGTSGRRPTGRRIVAFTIAATLRTGAS